VLFALRHDGEHQEEVFLLPCYTRLAKDTKVCDTQLREAAKGLEKAGFIKREKRGRSSYLLYINVSVLQKHAEENREADRLERAAAVDVADDPFEVTPFESSDPEDQDPDIDNTDGLDIEIAPEDVTPDENESLPLCRDAADVLQITPEIWPNHPTFNDPRGLEYLETDLYECIKLAQSPARCGQVLVKLATENERRING
jgi:hypothetical protein